MWNELVAWWRAVRWQRFQRACEQQGMTPFPTAEARDTARVLDDLTAFTEKSGFLRDGRYPGGRQAEKKIARTVARVQGRLGTRKVP